MKYTRSYNIFHRDKWSSTGAIQLATHVPRAADGVQ